MEKIKKIVSTSMLKSSLTLPGILLLCPRTRLKTATFGEQAKRRRKQAAKVRTYYALTKEDEEIVKFKKIIHCHINS
jgi:hypothetical protein